MLRTAVTQILPRAPARQLSTSSALFVRIRSQNATGGTSNPDPTTPASPTATPPPPPTSATPTSAPASKSKSKSKAQPTVAEAPPSPPPETTDPQPFTPEVHQASPSASTQTQADPAPVTGTGTASGSGETNANTPLTPPAADVEEVQEPKDGKYTLPSLDIDPEVALPEPTKAEDGEGGSGGRRRTGAGRKEYVSSIERQRKMMVRLGMGALAVGALGAAWYASQGEVSQILLPHTAHTGMVALIRGRKLTRQTDDTTSSWQRLKTNTSEMLDVRLSLTLRVLHGIGLIGQVFNKPAFKTLLPDPLPPPHQRPYTLVIDLEGLLVSSTWDVSYATFHYLKGIELIRQRTAGWRTAKRPGVDYFLAYLSQFYEIVLFTSNPSYVSCYPSYLRRCVSRADMIDCYACSGEIGPVYCLSPISIIPRFHTIGRWKGCQGMFPPLLTLHSS